MLGRVPSALLRLSRTVGVERPAYSVGTSSYGHTVRPSRRPSRWSSCRLSPAAGLYLRVRAGPLHSLPAVWLHSMPSSDTRSVDASGTLSVQACVSPRHDTEHASHSVIQSFRPTARPCIFSPHLAPLRLPSFPPHFRRAVPPVAPSAGLCAFHSSFSGLTASCPSGDHVHVPDGVRQEQRACDTRESCYTWGDPPVSTLIRMTPHTPVCRCGGGAIRVAVPPSLLPNVGLSYRHTVFLPEPACGPLAARASGRLV